MLETPRGRLTGVVCEPSERRRSSGDWVVFLNSGPVRRVGPNRLTTTFAREWARRGVASFRFDLSAIGDSDGDLGDERPRNGDSWIRRPEYLRDVADVLDWLDSERGASRFDLIGICSGGVWGFQTAIADRRVVGLALINPAPLFEDRRERPLQAWAQVHQIARKPKLVRTMRGNGLRELPFAATKGLLLTLIGKGDLGWLRAPILAALQQLESRGTRMLVVYSAGDKTIGCLQRPLGPRYDDVLARYGMSVEVVQGADHTFRPLWSHRLLQEALERHLVAISFLDLAPEDGS